MLEGTSEDKLINGAYLGTTPIIGSASDSRCALGGDFFLKSSLPARMSPPSIDLLAGASGGDPLASQPVY